jgi:hypothetical protein
MNMKWRILKTKTYEIISGTFFYISFFLPLLNRACWFNHNFTVPNHAQFCTLKTLKSHIKTLNICPYMVRSLMKPSSSAVYEPPDGFLRDQNI